MDAQTVINAVAGLMLTVGGWLLNALWQALKDLQGADAKLAEKVATIEVLVVGQYIKRDDFDKMSDAIFRKLDRIEGKLDGKVDRHEVRKA